MKQVARRQSSNIIDLRPKGPKGVDWEMLFAPPGTADRLGPFPGAVPAPSQMNAPLEEYELPESGPAGGNPPPIPLPPSGPQGTLDLNTLLMVLQALGSPPSQPNLAPALQAQLVGLYGGDGG